MYLLRKKHNILKMRKSVFLELLLQFWSECYKIWTQSVIMNFKEICVSDFWFLSILWPFLFFFDHFLIFSPKKAIKWPKIKKSKIWYTNLFKIHNYTLCLNLITFWSKLKEELKKTDFLSFEILCFFFEDVTLKYEENRNFISL